MAEPKDPPTQECTGCEIPVCLKFTGVTATDEFKAQMKTLFSGIFADLCNEDKKTK